MPLLSSCPILPATRIFTEAPAWQEVSAWQEVAPPKQRHRIEGEVAAGAGLPRSGAHSLSEQGQQTPALQGLSLWEGREGGPHRPGGPQQVLVHTRAQGPQQVCSEQRKKGRVVVWDSQKAESTVRLEGAWES